MTQDTSRESSLGAADGQDVRLRGFTHRAPLAEALAWVAANTRHLGPEPVAAADALLPGAVGLCDAWAGGADDGRDTTWGYQPPSHEFAPGRLDKVLYVPNGVCAVDRPERVGVGVKTALGQWASDHFGLMTSVRLLAAS